MTFVPTSQTPYFQAVAKIGSLIIPCAPGANLMCPKNLQLPPIIGNAYQWNVGEGLQSPTVDLDLIVRDVADEALGSTLMTLFFGRTNPATDVAFDTDSTTVTFWDGRTGFTMTGAKFEAFTLSCSMGQDIRLTARFVGTGITAIDSPMSLIDWSNANVLRFPHLTIADQTGATGTAGTPTSSGYLAGRAWSVNLSCANNHTPNLGLNGTVFPTDMNAGSPTAGASVTLQAADGPPLEGVPIVVTVGGSNITRHFSINNPLHNTDQNRQIGAPRVMRTYQLICRGLAGRDSTYTAGHQSSGPVDWS
jgi:hypothetical protein